MGRSSSISRNRPARSASDFEVRADRGIMKPASGARATDQMRGRAGRYSRTTQCPLAPPKPKELIPITTGCSGNGSISVCTRMGQLSKSISGFGTTKFFDVGAKVRRCIIRTTLSSAQ